MARSEAVIELAIANCEAILDAGATTVTQDGHTTVFNLRETAGRLRGLRKELAEVQGVQQKRPLFNRINLS
jgi:hypothetical protein